MHWLLARLRRLHPAPPQRAAIDALLDRHLAPANVAAECAYLQRPDAQAFERPYGWTWLLKLADELLRCEDGDARRWAGRLAPLAQAFADRYRGWLPRADYPVRYGMHSNSAFGVLFALDWARRAGDAALAALIEDKARAWFARDTDAPAAWEPSGFDFLSPSLVEAELMRRVLEGDGFLPGLAGRQPATLFTPARVADRADPHVVHLDGLNLSRAWCFRGIASALPQGDPRAAVAREAAAVHLAAGLDGVAHAGYAGSHWLASFAALALEA
jgi:FAD/FMN-containing dehydrogenase